MLPLVKMLCSHVGSAEVALEESQETRDKQQEEEQQNGLLPWPVFFLPNQLPVNVERFPTSGESEAQNTPCPTSGSSSKQLSKFLLPLNT